MADDVVTLCCSGFYSIPLLSLRLSSPFFHVFVVVFLGCVCVRGGGGGGGRCVCVRVCGAGGGGGACVRVCVCVLTHRIVQRVVKFSYHSSSFCK